jgi:hypothetical protein
MNASFDPMPSITTAMPKEKEKKYTKETNIPHYEV